MLIFKELLTASDLLKKEIINTDDKERLYELKLKLDLLNTLISYIKDGKWTKRSDIAARVNFTMRYGYKKASEEYNTSLNACKTAVSSASKKLYEMFGDNIVSTILNENIKVAEYQFLAGAGKLKLENILLSDVAKVLNDNENEKINANYDLKECLNELEFIKKYAYNTMLKELSSLDINKLNFLSSILDNGNEAFARERLYTMLFLEKDMSLDKFVEII